MNASLSRLVAGKEKILIGALALMQVYVAAVNWLVDPEKALVIGVLGLAQVWLGADSKTPPPTHPEGM